MNHRATATDHYETLMVERNSESFEIEAAYRRLAREFHPDINPAHDAHDRMVAINEAYETLSDSHRRGEYDRSLRARRTFVREPRRAERATMADEPGLEVATEPAIPAPVAPKPKAYGISPNYYDLAIEGALAWRERARLLTRTASAGIVGGAMLLATAAAAAGWINSAGRQAHMRQAEWFVLPMIVGAVLVGLEAIHDRQLLRRTFGPRYNPNPRAYAKYAEALAKYQSETGNVYISDDDRYHTNPGCSRLSTPRPIARYLAHFEEYRPCSKCGDLIVPPLLLPPPFGEGREP